MLKALTPCENEVLHLKAKGFIEKEIADRRCVSLNTVKAQTKSLIKKLRVSNGYEAVARYAAKNPDIFKHMVVAICMTAQSIGMFGTFQNEYRHIRKHSNNVLKVKNLKSRARRSRNLKLNFN